MSRKPATASETELKLRVPPAQWPRLLASPLLGTMVRELDLEASYYDTPSRALARQGIAYRVRREGRRWVQTLKGGGYGFSGLHVRAESESILADSRPRPQGLPRTAQAAVLRQVLAREPLEPVMQTRIRRILRQAAPARGVRIEIACDRGRIRGGGRTETVSELELELKSGPVEALFDLAALLVAEHGLTLEHRAKAARGFALADGAVPKPVKAEAPRIDAAMDAAALCRAVIAAPLAQVQANSDGVLRHDDPEFLHQMRVGLRRLRCALDLFSPWTGDALEREAAALRTIGSGLGEARDWDVLIGEILPQVFGRMPAGGAAGRLLKACVEVRIGARRKTNSIIKSNSYSLSMLTLGRFLAAPPAALTPARGARELAADILATRHARVLKRGRRLRRQDDAGLHRLRIAVKKLRYAVEFFTALFPAVPMQAQRASLTRLQDILGQINDAALIAPQLEAARRRNQRMRRPWPAAAAQSVLDGQQERARMQRKKLAPAWRQFRNSPQPWLHAGGGRRKSP